MMANVLTAADSLTCTVGHGSVQVQGAAKLVVAGQPVLTAAGVAGAPVSGCAPPGSPPPPPCTAVASLLSGQASKLLVSGSPVLLDQCSAQGGPPPHSIGPATASQSKLGAT